MTASLPWGLYKNPLLLRIGLKANRLLHGFLPKRCFFAGKQLANAVNWQVGFSDSFPEVLADFGFCLVSQKWGALSVPLTVLVRAAGRFIGSVPPHRSCCQPRHHHPSASSLCWVRTTSTQTQRPDTLTPKRERCGRGYA